MFKKEFEEISIPKWKLAVSGVATKVYRVFKSPTEFDTVEAESASEAAQKSGTQVIYMIKTGAADDTDYVNQAMLAPITA